MIKDRNDYENSVKRIYELMDMSPGKNTLQGDELESLIQLVEDYENKLYPLGW